MPKLICHLRHISKQSFKSKYNCIVNNLYRYTFAALFLKLLKMTSMPSDSESNVSGFIRYSDKDFKHLYTSMLENMEIINQDLLQVEKNMKNIVQQAGPLENQLNVLLQTFPKQNIALPMDTE